MIRSLFLVPPLILLVDGVSKDLDLSLGDLCLPWDEGGTRSSFPLDLS